MRKNVKLMDGWKFSKPGQQELTVDLPHTWNSGDALSGKQDYYRGMGN